MTDNNRLTKSHLSTDHWRVLLKVANRSNRNAPVSNRSPKMSTENIEQIRQTLANLFQSDTSRSEARTGDKFFEREEKSLEVPT